MLHAFISSQALRFGRTGIGGLTASVVTHTTIIVAAVLGTAATDITVAARPAAVAERIVFVSREMLERARSATTSRRPAAPRTTPTDRTLTAADVASIQLPNVTDIAVPDVPLDVGVLDLAARASGGIAFDGSDSRQLLRASQGLNRATYNGDDLYTEDMVETAVEARPGNPHPRYPRILQDDGVQDSFIVRFIVDSAGRVEPSTVTFPRRTHKLLIASVRDALLRSSYFPAEVGGHRVKQLVQQQFSFIMARR